MAKTWYPIIDEAACTACGACTQKCAQGVYDLAKAPAPVVARPESCVNHCHGCGNLCPQGAITYFGDDTGWTPPLFPAQAEDVCGYGCGCDCGGDGDDAKTVTVEYLYLDLNTCERCVGTDAVLEKALAEVTPALCAAGYQVDYRKVEIATAELAEQYRFLSSPTILVNGRDICPAVRENACGCCSDISGTAVDCRVFEFEGKTYEVPPKAMLAEAILRGAFAPAAESGCGCYTLPDNLRSFFDGKARKNSCCSGGCC